MISLLEIQSQGHQRLKLSSPAGLGRKGNENLTHPGEGRKSRLATSAGLSQQTVLPQPVSWGGSQPISQLQESCPLWCLRSTSTSPDKSRKQEQEDTTWPQRRSWWPGFTNIHCHTHTTRPPPCGKGAKTHLLRRLPQQAGTQHCLHFDLDRRPVTSQKSNPSPLLPGAQVAAGHGLLGHWGTEVDVILGFPRSQRIFQLRN